jgi:hypothetical protein
MAETSEPTTDRSVRPERRAGPPDSTGPGGSGVDDAPSKVNRVGAPLLYFLGVLLVAALAFVAAWPDMEASVFDAGTSAAAAGRLRLRCPWVIGVDEQSSIGVRFANDTDSAERFLVRTRVSRGYVTLVHQDSQEVRIEPHQAHEMSWPVEAGDAAYGRLVLARVFATRSASSPARDGACGVFVLGISGVDGDAVFLAGVLLGLVLTGAGALWWWHARRPLDVRQSSTARRVGMLAVIAIASLLTGMMGWWLLSHILLIASGLFVFMLLERAYSEKM